MMLSFAHITNIMAETCIKLCFMLEMLKGTKREKLHAMHVKESIKTNYSEW